MFEEYFEQIKAATIDAYPKELCGFITQGRGFYAVENVSSRPKHTFEIGKAATVQAMKEGLLAIVHSHPNSPCCPSEDDMKAQIASAVPWVLVSTNGEDASSPIVFGDGTPIPELVGRPFRHGVTDCYSLIRDYYKLEKGITLPEFPRDWEWWAGQEPKKLYQNGFVSAGFRAISEGEIQEGDVFLAQIRSDTPNHGGIYLGNELVLHHLTAHSPIDATRLSLREPITRWKKHITHWLRHEANSPTR